MKTTSSIVDIDTNVNESVVNTQDVSIYDEEFWDSFATVVATTISDRNYLYNTSFGNVTSYIYGQEYTNYHMGASTLAHGGCGIIATYNALRLMVE